MRGAQHDNGELMKKRRFIVTSSFVVADGMRTTCTGEHAHITAAAVNIRGKPTITQNTRFAELMPYTLCMCMETSNTF